jgi:hypothetical protein
VENFGVGFHNDADEIDIIRNGVAPGIGDRIIKNGTRVEAEDDDE